MIIRGTRHVGLFIASEHRRGDRVQIISATLAHCRLPHRRNQMNCGRDGIAA